MSTNENLARGHAEEAARVQADAAARRRRDLAPGYTPEAAQLLRTVDALETKGVHLSPGMMLAAGYAEQARDAAHPTIETENQ